MLLKDVIKDIALYQKLLIRRAKKSGLKENFGQKEVSDLEEKYRDYQYKNDGIWDAIISFDKWCQNLDLNELTAL